MMGPHNQGRRGADHVALLGLTEVANRKTGDGAETPGTSARMFVGGSLTPQERPLREPSRTDETSAARHATKAEEGAALRKYAATLLSDASGTATNSAIAPATVKSDKVSPFAMAAMLLVAGLVFLMVIPPVGVTFLLCAVLPIIWGAGSAVLKSPS